MQLFKCIKGNWELIDQDKYEGASTDEVAKVVHRMSANNDKVYQACFDNRNTTKR